MSARTRRPRGHPAALVSALAVAGCNLHPANNDGTGAVNVDLAGSLVFVARGEGGLDVVSAGSAEVLHHEDPSGEVSSFDDLSADGDLLVTLDADDGLLSSYRVRTDGRLLRVETIEVPVGPYSGVSMAGGVAVVSGGTSEITLVAVARTGAFGDRRQLEAFRGQPDVTMHPAGDFAVLSTHFSGSEDELVDGSEFGLSLLDARSGRIVDTVGLAGAGFTDGGGTPASWPTRVALRGAACFAAHGGGLTELSLADEGKLEVVRELALEGAGVDVALVDDRAFVVTAEPAAVVEVDLAGWSVVRSSALGGEEAGTGVVATRERIFVAGNVGGLLVLDR